MGLPVLWIVAMLRLVKLKSDLPPSSLSDLKEIGYKSVWLVYISPLSAHKGQ
jgi:hypothetical protein